MLKYSFLIFNLIVQISNYGCDEVGLFEVNVKTEEQLRRLIDLATKLNWDWWKQPFVGGAARFSTRSDNKNIEYIKSHLQELQLQLTVVNKNLDGTIEKEMKDNAKAKAMSQFRSGNGNGIMSYFASHSEYNAWLNSLKVNSPANMVTLTNIGKSYEGRDMIVAKVSTGGNKQAMFIDGGIHAREWLGVSSVVWILNKFVDGLKTNDARIKKIFDKFDLYVLPVSNPDGYELTRQGGRNRMWRKNTMPVAGGCKGVDLNRNFDADFGVSGVSKNPCDVIYPGEKPFSAPETQHFRDFVLTIKDKLKLFISFHAYSQLLLTPFAYTKSPPPHNDDIMRVAGAMVNAIKANSGLYYEAGSPANILYAASGGCYDWVSTKVGVKYSYTFEVRPTQRDRRGFLAPVSWIKPAGDELFEGVAAAAEAV